MAKELGQIHSVSYTNNITPAMSGGVPRRYDLAERLCDKLQRMVRQGNYFKLVGIDISMEPNVIGPGNGGSITGSFRYYSPTKGRCSAFRHAFKAQADQMKMQGIPMRENVNYDFRVALSSTAGIAPVLANQATMDGTNGLALNSGVAGASVFGVYNKSVLPTLAGVAAADLFDEGFDTLLQSGGAKTDFVLNEQTLWEGNEDYADLTYDYIPFQVSYDAAGNTTLALEWRPDPALYVAVMTGNLEMQLDECAVTGGAASLDVNVTFYVSGWKSIMGNPDKKKKNSRRKSSSRNK